MPRPAIHQNAAARQRAYRARQRGEQPEQPVGPEVTGNEPRDVLEAISKDTRAPASSRVQAARALIDSRASGGEADEERVWLAIQGALRLIPEPDRLRWLLGEIGEPIPSWVEGHASVSVEPGADDDEDGSWLLPPQIREEDDLDLADLLALEVAEAEDAA